jgi:hypothetical protein
MRIVELAPHRNADAIKLAQKILAQTESGEVVSIIAILSHSDGGYQNVGTHDDNSAGTAGRLLAAAIDVLAASVK